MNSILIKNLKQGEKSNYPCIKTSKEYEQTVLFIAPCAGFVLNSGKTNFPVGHFVDRWYEDDFEYSDSIIISNGWGKNNY